MKDYMGHYSVLKNETIQLLQPQAAGVWIDGTLGEAGHAAYALESYPEIELIGLDADAMMLDRAKARLIALPSHRYQLYHQFFNDFFKNYPAHLAKPATILLDLGISMFHYKEAERGFSYHDTKLLDMRLNPESLDPSASELINLLSEKELADLFWRYGEERKSRQIAALIVKSRKIEPIQNALQLSQLIKTLFPASSNQYLHPAAKSFQALRIAVNQELRRLEETLPNAFQQLVLGGKLGIITFHSLEDRIVKHFFQNLTKRCQCPDNLLKCRCEGAYAKAITTKAIVPTIKELQENSASRSAKLRVVQKIRAYSIS